MRPAPANFNGRSSPTRPDSGKRAAERRGAPDCARRREEAGVLDREKFVLLDLRGKISG